MKASDYLARFLVAQGVPQVFEVVGGTITHLLDSMHCLGGPLVVSMHHEQAAAFAAEGFARMTGRPGVALATSGPGATNLLTGIGSCYFDSTPTVFITGQVNRAEQKGGRPIRQLGFQEVDIVSMAAPITKMAARVRDPRELPEICRLAFATAQSGRPGPVLIDIPTDVQRAEISEDPLAHAHAIAVKEPDAGAVREALDVLRRARRPLILVGGGLRSSGAVSLFRVLLDSVHVPVVHSLMAADALPYTHPQRIGLIGSYGNRWANLAITRSDAMLVLGSRLDVRQTGADTDGFRADRAIVHVDCDPGEVNNRVVGCRPIIADLAAFLRVASGLAAEAPIAAEREWCDEIEGLRRKWPDTHESRTMTGINPNEFCHTLSRAADPAAYVTDVGQHQMWAAQSIELDAGQRFLTSGGMGAMGFGLPAAIGAALSAAGRSIVLLAGDGGFQLNIQELETVRRQQLPIKMIVLNNNCLGMVRQFQQSYFAARYRSTLWGYTAPDFARVAAAYDIEASTIAEPAEIEPALARFLADPARPALLQVMIDPAVNAYPKLPFGRSLGQMEPEHAPADGERSS